MPNLRVAEYLEMKVRHLTLLFTFLPRLEFTLPSDAARELYVEKSDGKNARTGRMAEVILAAPLFAGKMEVWRRFCQEISGRRRAEHEASRRLLGISHETAALVTLPAARTVTITITADNLPQVLHGLAVSELPFDRWFRRRLLEICGLNFSCFSSGVEKELLFRWSRIS